MGISPRPNYRACHGPGSTINFKSLIKIISPTSNVIREPVVRIVNHFLDCHDGDHSLLKFVVIDQHHDMANLGNVRIFGLECY